MPCAQPTSRYGPLKYVVESSALEPAEVAELVSKEYAHIRPPAILARARDARYLDRPELKK